ncbi:hypothetical protein D3C76_1265570 [compost metagenome]
MGSRDLFSRFLKSMDEPAELANELDGICLKLNGLRMNVLRSVETQTIKSANIQDKLDQLYEKENQFLQLLQVHIRNAAIIT